MSTVQHTLSDASETLLNRELSRIDLMRRVLELAADADEPLLERVRFCGIVSSILDEFFMVRVAGLLDQVVSGLVVRSPDGRTPQQTLSEVRDRALELVTEQTRSGATSSVRRSPAKASASARSTTCDDAEDAQLETVFLRQIYPVLTPLAVGPGQPFPYISGLSLSLGVIVRDPEAGEERFARVKVPEGLAVRRGRRSRPARPARRRDRPLPLTGCSRGWTSPSARRSA